MKLSASPWQILPPGFDPAKKYPLMLYVYGEPWGSTVTDSWMGNRYLWHRMLAEQGYVVMSFDNPVAQEISGRNMRIAIIAARYNSMLVDALLKHVMASLVLATPARVEAKSEPGLLGILCPNCFKRPSP